MRAETARAAVLPVALGVCVCAARATAGEDRATGSRLLPGDLRLGALYLRPRLRVETLGLDTNVFYSATGRRADFTASGGPGLDAILPLRGGFRLSAGGDLGYVYFRRTESQRRATAQARAGLQWNGARLGAGVQGTYGRSFARPSFEVDERVAETARGAGADVRADIGARVRLALAASTVRREVERGAAFAGVDLQRALSDDARTGGAELAYRLTPKTSLLLLADARQDHFRLAPERDADSERLGGGLQVDSATRLFGRATGGMRRFRFRRGGPGARSAAPFAEVDAGYRLGPRTVLGAAYRRGQEHSAFTPELGVPLLVLESVGLRAERRLGGPFDLRLRAALTRFHTESPVRIDGVSGTATGVRADRVREAGADLGCRFLSHLRLGVAANWVERRSSFADLGLQGLVMGATLGYVP